MGISQMGQYFIGITYQLLLNSDQKSYVQLIVNGITLLCNTAICILLMACGANIQTVKLTTSLIYLMRPLIMRCYVRKKYTIDYNASIDSTVVTQKKSGIIQHIAYMLYENTDVMVLTVFSTLKNVSVYSVYTLVTNSIKQIINAATTGVQALLGNMIAKEETESLVRFYSFYNWTIHTISSLLFTITGLLLVPFVKLYTSNITDAEYYAPTFAALITLAYYFSSIRNCNYVLIRAAGHYKKTQSASLIEAALNLAISIIFVFNLGLVGVAIGTIIATVFFVVFEIIYFSKNIIFVPFKNSIKPFLTDFLTMGLGILMTLKINIFSGTVISWILQAVVISLICLGISLAIQVVFYRKNMINLKAKILKKYSGG